MLASAGYVLGATITVTTTEPGINADGLCSFAEAVENVSDGDVHSDCEAGGDGLNIIELGQGETYLQREGDWYDMPEEFVVINGNGSTFDAMDEEVGWVTLLLGDAIINDLTIKGSTFDYGAIWVLAGRLSLNRCIIRDNYEGVWAGSAVIVATDSAFLSNNYGIHNYSEETTLIAINTDFVGNEYAIRGSGGSTTLIGCNVEDNGIGIEAHSVDIRYSTIINNGLGVKARSGSIRHSTVAGNGTGVRLGDYGSGSGPYQFIFMSSTFSGNTGYGIEADRGLFGGWMGTAYIRDSTITGNTIGLDSESFQYEVKNSIISSNAENCRGYWSGDSSSRGFNLTDDDTCGLSNPTDMRVDDVLLSELGDWGGSTQTHIPLEGSPAIDMVKWASQCSPRDQRGYVRPADGEGNGVAHCDCGAVEYGAVPPPRPYDPRTRASAIE